MTETSRTRYVVEIEQGPPRGDRYELEQTEFFRVVETPAGRAVLVFEGCLTAALSRDAGLWDDYAFSGVAAVEVGEDQKTVLVIYHNGCREIVRQPPVEKVARRAGQTPALLATRPAVSPFTVRALIRRPVTAALRVVHNVLV